jgi:hypothetical protein
MKPTDLHSPNLYAFADFETLLDFEQTAALISERLLEGIKFELKEDLRDEVPAMATKRCLLGFWFVLIDQNDPEELQKTQSNMKMFTLEMGQDEYFRDMYFALPKDLKRSIDLGHWLAAILNRIPQFHLQNCSPAGSIAK